VYDGAPWGSTVDVAKSKFTVGATYFTRWMIRDSAGVDQWSAATPMTLTTTTTTTTTTTQPPSEAITTLDTGGVGLYSSVAVDAGDGFRVLYYDATNGDLKLSQCLNVLCTGYGYLNSPATAGDTGLWPAMVLGTTGADSGNPFFLYYDATTGNLMGQSCSSHNCGNSSPGYFGLAASSTVSVAMNQSHQPVFSFSHDGKLYIKVCQDFSCGGRWTNGSGGIVDPNPGSNNGAGPNMGRFSSIAVGPDNNPVVSYLDSDNGFLRVKRCRLDTCSDSASNPRPTDLVSTGVTTDMSQTSLVVPGSGNPVISYFKNDSASATNPTSGSLNVFACDDPDCSTGTNTVVDSSGVTGQGSAMALVDGLPVIAYYDRSNQDLKLARCSNEACTASVLSVVDSVGVVGSGVNSIAVAPGGADYDARIGITYYDETNQALKIAVLPAS